MTGPIASMDQERRRARRNVILALVHVLLVAVILAGFVYVQGHT